MIANTQRRAHARKLAIEYLVVGTSPRSSRDLRGRVSQGAGSLEAQRSTEAVRGRAQARVSTVVFLAQPDPEGERSRDEITFDSEALTALDGTHVWKALVERQKAFDVGQFSAKALLHNLRDSDYGRPLSEVRDSFWQAPRLPLLPGGEGDLRQAIFDAVQESKLRIVDGPARRWLSPASVRSISRRMLSGWRNQCPSAGPMEAMARVEMETVRTETGHGGTDGGGEAGGDRKVVSFTLMKPLTDPDTSEKVAQVFMKLYEIADEGDASHIQGSIQIVVSADKAPDLIARAEELGITVTSRDQ